MLLPGALEALLNLQEAIDRTFDAGFFDGAISSLGVYPPVNIFKKNGDMVLVAELAGIKKKDLNIEAKGNTIRLAGERTIEHDKNVSYHRIENRLFTL